MKTFADIIDALGGSIALAEALDQPKGTVSAWKTRNSIPAEHWAEIVKLAGARGLPAITHEVLARLAPARKRAPSSEAPKAA